MVYFPLTNVYGSALNLETDQVGCIIFGDESKISQNDIVHRKNRLVSVKVGPFLLSRVVNALGNFVDDKEKIYTIADKPLYKPTAEWDKLRDAESRFNQKVSDIYRNDEEKEAQRNKYFNQYERFNRYTAMVYAQSLLMSDFDAYELSGVLGAQGYNRMLEEFEKELKQLIGIKVVEKAEPVEQIQNGVKVTASCEGYEAIEPQIVAIKDSIKNRVKEWMNASSKNMNFLRNCSYELFLKRWNLNIKLLHFFYLKKTLEETERMLEEENIEPKQKEMIAMRINEIRSEDNYKDMQAKAYDWTDENAMEYGRKANGEYFDPEDMSEVDLADNERVYEIFNHIRNYNDSNPDYLDEDEDEDEDWCGQGDSDRFYNPNYLKDEYNKYNPDYLDTNFYGAYSEDEYNKPSEEGEYYENDIYDLEIREVSESECPTMNIERKAPGVITRQSVSEPMLTGYKVVDGLLPIGRGNGNS